MQQNAETFKKFLTALGSGDEKGLEETLHPDAVITSMETGAMAGARDRATILATLGMFRDLVPDGIEFEIVSLTAQDNRLAAEFKGRATLRNGAAYNNNYVFITEYEDGKIKSGKEYYCSLLVNTVLVKAAQECGVPTT